MARRPRTPKPTPLSTWERIKKANAMANNNRDVQRSSDRWRHRAAEGIGWTLSMATAGAGTGAATGTGLKGAAVGALAAGALPAAFYGTAVGVDAVDHWKNKGKVIYHNYKALKARGESIENKTKPLRTILENPLINKI